MTDLQTQAEALNATFAAKHIPLIATAGKTAIKFAKFYDNCGHGTRGGPAYGIAAAKARAIIRAYTI